MRSFHIEMGFSCTLSCNSNLFPYDMTHFETEVKSSSEMAFMCVMYNNCLSTKLKYFLLLHVNFNFLQASSVSNTSRYVDKKT